MKILATTTVLFVIGFLTLWAQDTRPEKSESRETAAIKKVLVDAYVKGIHIQRDPELVESGFHPKFVMYVLTDDQVIQAPLNMWLDRLKLDGKSNEKVIDYQFGFVDVTGATAVAKMEIHEGSKHIYTDYFFLYHYW